MIKSYEDKNCWMLDEAANYIGKFCRKYARISVTDIKEKWFTVRVYCSFGIYCLHDLFYPGYTYYQSKILKWLDFKISITRPVQAILAVLNNILIIRYQQFIYRLAYKKAIKKYPEIREEILYCADWEDLLGGL